MTSVVLHEHLNMRIPDTIIQKYLVILLMESRVRHWQSKRKLRSLDQFRGVRITIMKKRCTSALLR